MTRITNRWFPRHRGRTRLQAGWELAENQSWDAETHANVELLTLRLAPNATLVLSLRVDEGRTRAFSFPGVEKLSVEGRLDLGREGNGWEVLGSSMLVTGLGRGDGRVVYLLELPQAVITFASFRGAPESAPTDSD